MQQPVTPFFYFVGPGLASLTPIEITDKFAESHPNGAVMYAPPPVPGQKSPSISVLMIP